MWAIDGWKAEIRAEKRRADREREADKKEDSGSNCVPSVRPIERERDRECKCVCVCRVYFAVYTTVIQMHNVYMYVEREEKKRERERDGQLRGGPVFRFVYVGDSLSPFLLSFHVHQVLLPYQYSIM